jgi:hypothetical protein
VKKHQQWHSSSWQKRAAASWQQQHGEGVARKWRKSARQALAAQRDNQPMPAAN